MFKSQLIAITSVVALVAQTGRIQAVELPPNLVNNPSRSFGNATPASFGIAITFP
jgi:hypothetical protein